MITNKTRKRKVLFIGIDGCCAEALAYACTPGLDYLIKTGNFHKSQALFPTISGPMWSSMLTSYAPQDHKVIDNSFVNNQLANYPTFFQKLKEQIPGIYPYAKRNEKSLA